jgi:hypothetical protein
MANRRDVRKAAESPLSRELLALVKPTSQSLPDVAMKEGIPAPNLLSSVKPKVKTYVPSPPSGSAGAFPKYMAALNAEQRESINQFIQATKEPTSVAIQTLKECDWDLLEAISRFGGDEDDDGDAQDHPEKETYAPPVALKGSRHGSDVREWVREWMFKEGQRKREAFDLFRRVTLQRLTLDNGQDWPQCPRNVAYEPITLQYLPSSPNTHTIPKFSSPYGENKLWYTGSMRP